MTAPAHLDAIAARFALAGPVIWIEELPGGHINDSYRVLARRPNGAEIPYLLQHVNPRVFPDAVRVMENIAYVTRHLEAQRRAQRTRRQTLTLVPTTAGGAWMEDAARTCWRMYAYLPGTRVSDIASDPSIALEAASAYGEFLRLLASYDGPALHETIAGFHDTPARFRQLEAAVAADPLGRAQDAREEVRELLSHRSLATVLPERMATGEIPRRIAHNDAKLSNVLLDAVTGAATCVVDLDTVMPGSLLHDFGDMVRSMTTPTVEDETDLGRVGVRLDLFEGVARGFLQETRDILAPAERELLVHAGLVITLEQAVRFLTDYLEGDKYYHDTRGDQNLRRTRAQLQLFRTLVERADELEDVIRGI